MNNSYNLSFDLKLLKTKSISKSEIIEMAGKQMNKKGRDNLDWLYDDLVTAMTDKQINSPLRIAHFLSQILVESSYFAKLEESLNYRDSALEATFSYFKKHPEDAKRLGRHTKIGSVGMEKQKEIANLAYASSGGNMGGSDGWTYRGRGLMQLTGRSNYDAFGKAMNQDFISNPDTVAYNPTYAVKSATWYWSTHEGNYYADKDEFAQVTFKINGGFNGFDDRLKILTKSKIVLGIPLDLQQDLQYSRDKDAIANAYSYRKKDKGAELKSLFN